MNRNLAIMSPPRLPTEVYLQFFADCFSLDASNCA